MKVEQQEERAEKKENDTPQTSDPTVVYGKQLLTILFHPTEYSIGIQFSPYKLYLNPCIYNLMCNVTAVDFENWSQFVYERQSQISKQ